MKKYTIPEDCGDLKRAAIWKNLKYLLIFVVYVTFFVAAFVFFLNRRHEDAVELSWWIFPLFVTCVVISGWIICFMTRFVGDRYVCGKIEDIKCVRSFDRGLSRSGKFSLDEHTYLKLKVNTEKGDIKYLKIPLFDDGYDGYFVEGRNVVKFRGLTYPLVLESENEGMHLCTVCGTRKYFKDGKGKSGEEMRCEDMLYCPNCSHSFIDTRKL